MNDQSPLSQEEGEIQGLRVNRQTPEECAARNLFYDDEDSKSQT